MSALKISTYLLLFLAPGYASFADEIYKSIDKHGRVQYSTIAPDASGAIETISLLPEPSDETIRAAQQDLKKFKEKLVKRARIRAEQNQSEPKKSKKSNITGDSTDNMVPARSKLIAVTPFL